MRLLYLSFNLNNMRIAFIGAGNVATVLARLLQQAGNTITGIYSASQTSAQKLGDELGVAQAGTLDNIDTSAEVYIIAVADNAIASICKTLKLPGKIVLHTSGSTPQQVLATVSADYGVMYPLQSIRKEAAHQPEIPFLINASNAEVLQKIKLLAAGISTMVEEADDSKRLALHLAAVMVSNFTNFLYTLASDYCAAQQVEFKTLVPLIKEVAGRTALYNPAVMQTGPASRGDSMTIEKHLQLLQGYPLQQAVYTSLTNSIIEYYRQP